MKKELWRIYDEIINDYSKDEQIDLIKELIENFKSDND